MPAKLSVVIPTYNRPQLLRRALRFLRTEGRIPIIVADGSLPDAAETNAATCKGMGGNVHVFSPAQPRRLGCSDQQRDSAFEHGLVDGENTVCRLLR